MSVATAESAVLRVKMAGIGTGRAPDTLETLLGSCVGVCIWDRTNKLGALAHVVLSDSQGRVTTTPGKFADTAVAELKKQLLAQGAHPRRLTAKIAGGATMFGPRGERDVGEKNYRAVLEQLRKHAIPKVAEHIGGNQGRLIRFATHDGSVAVLIGRQQVTTL